jgi:hypothetical protein
MTRPTRWILGTAALVLLAPAAALSQSLEALAPSARIRVDVLTADGARFPRFGRSHAQPLIGRFTAARGDTVLLAIQPGAEPLRVPRSAIRAVHVSRGRPPRWQSALRSAVVPALVGAAVRGLGTSVRGREGDPTPAQAALSGAAMSGALAAAKGALFPKERWQQVSLPVVQPADSSASPRREIARAVGTRR